MIEVFIFKEEILYFSFIRNHLKKRTEILCLIDYLNGKTSQSKLNAKFLFRFVEFIRIYKITKEKK